MCSAISWVADAILPFSIKQSLNVPTMTARNGGKRLATSSACALLETLCARLYTLDKDRSIIVHAFSEPDSASTTVASSGLYVTGKNSSRPREALKMNKDVQGTSRSRGRTA